MSDEYFAGNTSRKFFFTFGKYKYLYTITHGMKLGVPLTHKLLIISILLRVMPNLMP
jgi:hypothetical protein